MFATLSGFYLFKTTLFIWRGGGGGGVMHVWWSEDNLQALVLSFRHVEPRDYRLYPLNHLPPPFLIEDVECSSVEKHVPNMY